MPHIQSAARPTSRSSRPPNSEAVPSTTSNPSVPVVQPKPAPSEPKKPVAPVHVPLADTGNPPSSESLVSSADGVAIFQRGALRRSWPTFGRRRRRRAEEAPAPGKPRDFGPLSTGPAQQGENGVGERMHGSMSPTSSSSLHHLALGLGQFPHIDGQCQFRPACQFYQQPASGDGAAGHCLYHRPHAGPV